ncbi:NADH dehydrogenase [ubiquinone] 1 alpha subcomplex assembly factor 3 [Anabrus simplex]|uniref:NADH dehydrogenase [ubiquinone] 1 alpha subcomplex assembly factor 3 n=1 Tax=Anabrus simplex TaxID=316456 RepID=UPI0034DD0A7F
MYLLSILSRGLISRNRIIDSLKYYKPICESDIKVSRRHSSSYESDGKTTVHILNKDSELGLMINSYSQLGFRLNNGLMVLGPMAIFPRSVLSWNVSGVEDINEDSLSLFCYLEPKIDILVLGIGDERANAQLNRNIIKVMRKHRINVEALTTEQACATFNFLNAENRYVAGALIPPNDIRPTEDDIMATKLRNKRLYEVEDDY